MICLFSFDLIHKKNFVHHKTYNFFFDFMKIGPNWKCVLRFCCLYIEDQVRTLCICNFATYWCILYTTIRGSFNKYLDIILPFLPPFCEDSFYTLIVDKNRHFLTPSPSSCPRSYWMPPWINQQWNVGPILSHHLFNLGLCLFIFSILLHRVSLFEFLTFI